MASKDANAESTLESEIDALSKIITDAKDTSPKLAGNDDDFKLDVDDVTFDQGLQCSTVQDEELALKDILSESSELDSFISATDSSFKTAPNVTLKFNEQDQTADLNVLESEGETVTEDCQNESVLDADDTLNANNSLSLISEAYTSQESQSCSDSPPATVTENQELPQEEDKRELDSENIDGSQNVNIITNVEKSSENNKQVDKQTKLIPEAEQKKTDNLKPKGIFDDLENDNVDLSVKGFDESDLCSNISVLQSSVTKDNLEKEIIKSKELNPEEVLDNLFGTLDSREEQNIIDSDKVLENISDIPIDDQPQNEECIESLEDVTPAETIDASSNLKKSQERELPIDTNSENISGGAENLQSSLSEADFEPYEDAVDSDNNIEIPQGNSENKEDTRLINTSMEQLITSEKEIEEVTKESNKEVEVQVSSQQKGNVNDTNVDPVINSVTENLLLDDQTSLSVNEEYKKSSGNIQPLKITEVITDISNTDDLALTTNTTELKSLSGIEQKEETTTCSEFLETTENTEETNTELLTKLTLGNQIVESEKIEEKEHLADENKLLEKTENLESTSDTCSEKPQINASSSDQEAKVDCNTVNTENPLNNSLTESDFEPYEENTSALDKSEDNSEVSTNIAESESITSNIDSEIKSESEKLSNMDKPCVEILSTETQEFLDIEKNEKKSEKNNLTEDSNKGEIEESQQLTESGIIEDLNLQKSVDDKKENVLGSNEKAVSGEQNNENNKDKEMKEKLLPTNNIQLEKKEAVEADNTENERIDECMTETSESETAVKFLQESENNMETANVEENVTDLEPNSSIFVSVEDSICDNASDVGQDTTLDPIAISEAEIISEAAKLESEKRQRLELEQKLESAEVQEPHGSNVAEMNPLLVTDDLAATEKVDKVKDTLQIPSMPEIMLKSKPLPTASILEDRYKEPPKIEIPEISPQIIDLPSDALKTSTEVEKEVPRQRLDTPERQTISEPKITDTPRKDSDKQHQNQPHQQFSESENVGSPRIILKIAKSAIADCSEPRSPKSPKIRSAANSPNPDDSPSHKLGKIKLKLSKGGHPSIIPSSDSGYDETVQWHTETSSTLSAHGGMKIKIAKTSEVDKEEEEVKEKSSVHKQKHKELKEVVQETSIPKKQDSLGMKIKLSKSGDASIIQDNKLSEDYKETRVKDKIVEDIQESTRRTESPLGMKIKLSKTGDASIISNDSERLEADDTNKVKTSKDSDAAEIGDETIRAGKTMKIKLTKTGEASIVHDDVAKKSTEQPLGMMKIKLSKTGDPSIIHSETPKEMKHPKNKDYSIADQQKSKDDSHLEMKIKLSKTGHPTIIASSESQDLLAFKESTLKELKRSHTDVTIEPIAGSSMENTMVTTHGKRKEITVAPIESKKAKMEADLKQMFPDITIHPVAKKEQQVQQSQQKLMLDSKSGNISQQQMNVINQEISITQVCSVSSGTSSMIDENKRLQGVMSSPLNSDCEIIDPQPELIIVNENSNSSQDIMIIDEVPKTASKVPKKRGRPRRNPAPVAAAPAMVQPYQELELARDPLSLEQPPMMMLQQHMPMQMQQSLSQVQQPQHLMPQIVPSGKGSEVGRPRRTCRSQKSYAPPKRGRGRGRGKRKNESMDIPMKKSRIEQNLTEIEKSTTAVIALEKLPLEVSSRSPELFKALSQPMLSRIDAQSTEAEIISFPPSTPSLPDCEIIQLSPEKEAYQSRAQETVVGVSLRREDEESLSAVDQKSSGQQIVIPQIIAKGTSDVTIKVTRESDKQPEIIENAKDSLTNQEHQNWIAPSIKKVSSDSSSAMKNESISTLTVIDEETRMSAESGSRSQTPARSVHVPGGPEALVTNEESQGSVLSTATTESEKVKVKTRRMEITCDPDDQGPFTVEKIAEYEWPLERKDDRPTVRGETFMIQEQVSQYLGVKSFKRKYPDLKRRMVDMEERNYLREHGLVSESMCDMGLTAVSSSEVLDIMCSDFPEQYEEYRKHMREKAAKEHSKKQKELSAAANAERTRIDLAEMAMQSALAWNAGLNKARRDSRKCSLDLQTFTVHVPHKYRSRKFDPNRRNNNNYPVALMPGQYAEYYREYTPAELRYYPLNTVLYGPMRPNERKFDSQSEGSQSDSDSDSSSDDSSSSSSEGTQDTEGSQSTMDEVDMELAIQSDIKCKICLNNYNKNNRPEVLVQCGTCNGNVHPSCIELTLDMVPHIRAYAWQCTDCKTCAQCHDPADEDKMLFCDMCDRGYHIYCVGLRRVPQGRWHCQECAVCANCGSKEPGGANSDRNSVAQWQHEYKKGDKNTRVYVSTFCVPCSKLRGNQGNDNRQEKLFV